MSSPCPDDAALERAVHDPGAEAALFEHLEVCGRCSERAARISATGGLIDEVRVLADAMGDAEDCPAIEGYTLHGEIHRGGQGVVYDAVDDRTAQRVAVKVMIGGPWATSRRRRRFEREIDLVSGLRHRNIVPLLASGTTDSGLRYFVLDRIDGVDLATYVEAGDRAVELAERLRLFLSIARAVEYAHQMGVVHRDLKPQNILVDANGEPHLLDFGLAKGRFLAFGSSSAALTRTGDFFGSFAWASPEQIRAQGETDERTDVHALGLLLYYLLAERHPFPVDGSVSDVIVAIRGTVPSPPSRAARARLDRRLDRAVARALEKDPARRYPTVRSFAADVERSSEPRSERITAFARFAIDVPRALQIALVTLAALWLVQAIDWTALRDRVGGSVAAERESPTPRSESSGDDSPHVAVLTHCSRVLGGEDPHFAPEAYLDEYELLGCGDEIRYVRLAFHFLLTGERGGNFRWHDDGQGRTDFTAYDFAEAIVRQSNERLSNNEPMSLPAEGEHAGSVPLRAINVRFYLAGVYFHTQDELYALESRGGGADCRLFHAYEDEDDRALDVFFVSDGTDSRLRGQVGQCPSGGWIRISNSWPRLAAAPGLQEVENLSRATHVAKLLIHDSGHLFGLFDDWTDDLRDTPKPPAPGEHDVRSNNVMGTASQKAWTPGQIARVHRALTVGEYRHVAESRPEGETWPRSPYFTLNGHRAAPADAEDGAISFDRDEPVHVRALPPSCDPPHDPKCTVLFELYLRDDGEPLLAKWLGPGWEHSDLRAWVLEETRVELEVGPIYRARVSFSLRPGAPDAGAHWASRSIRFRLTP